jgi:hypothetical protein
MSSSQKPSSKILGVLGRPEAERCLLQWANLRDLPYSSEQRALFREKLSAGIPLAPTEECRKMVERNPQVFGPNALDWEAHGVHGFGLTVFDLIEIRDLLRLVWKAQERRSREWYSFQLRQRFYFWQAKADFWRTHPHTPETPIHPTTMKAMSELSWLDPPPVTGFEAAVFYLQTSIADRAKYCGNPDCPAPYFIALKRWQKFCSEECAGPVNREQKRRWWHENKGGKGLL